MIFLLNSIMTLIHLNIICSLLLGIELSVVNSQMCTDPWRFGDVIQSGQERRGAAFKSIYGVELVQCWKICVQYSLCTSINLLNSKCTLLSGENLEVVSKVGSLTSEKKNWPMERIAGKCYNQNCSKNARCIEASKGFICETIGCVDPPADHSVFSFIPVWTANDSVAIPCNMSVGCTQLYTCQRNGSWSNKEGTSPSCLNESNWTNWVDMDNPGGTGDYETIRKFREKNPGILCTNPSSLDVRLTSGEDYQLGGDFLILSPSFGLVCQNKHQTDETCQDYKVRFCC